MNPYGSAALGIVGMVAITVLAALGKVDGEAALAAICLYAGGAAGHAIGSTKS